MEKIRTTVRVAGKDYTIASYDPEAHVQDVYKRQGYAALITANF